MKSSFLKVGHLPTLVSAFLYFDLSFMVWVMLGPLGVFIAKDLHLAPGQKGLMVATPVLAGAVLRLINGVLVDHLGAKLVGVFMQVVVIAGLATAWTIGIGSFEEVLAFALVLGVAGASFAIALPLASYWYPSEHQGTALGIAGAGNSGTVLASLFAPALAAAFGWRNVLGLAAIPLVVVFVVFCLFAKNSPSRPRSKSLSDYLKVLAIDDAWWLMFFYAVSFGGFVGLSSFLPIYFHDQYGLSPVGAGYFTAACVFTGSLLRPVGGAIADRVGGLRTLSVMYLVAAAALIGASASVPQATIALGIFIVGMGALGMGNGAVFQLVPQRFGREVGVMTGLVGMTGGIGGFYLAASLGYAKQFVGNYSLGFSAFACLALLALAGVASVRERWRGSAKPAIAAARLSMGRQNP
jgi:NNP family nitrate/nitrite transporter-like MFS transporter